VDCKPDPALLQQVEVEKAPTPEELQSYSYSRWNTVLEFLVTADNNLPVAPRVITYLLNAGLMQRMDSARARDVAEGPPQKRQKATGGKSGKLSITSSGYEYMLLDIQTQVWFFVLESLKGAGAAKSSDQVDILFLIFMLSFCRVGEGYPLRMLSTTQRMLLNDLCDMGLVCIPGSTLFFPTHIAINMLHIAPDFSSGNAVGSKIIRDNALNSMSLTIIVETNFQVVAYVNSNLHLAMLSLFVDTRTMIRLPNMVSSAISMFLDN
jgi:transcription initiation factor TFIIH subunit 4